MAGPSRHGRGRASNTDGIEVSRPRKMRRLGTTREDPIILDDSEAGTAAASPASTDDDLFEVDAYGNPVVTSTTKLFYTDTGRGRRTPAFRSLPILTKKELSGKAKQDAALELSPGWPTVKNNRVVNIYLEGEQFATLPFNRQCHLHTRGSDAPDSIAIHLQDLRRELARLLDVEDPLSLQLEIQHARALAISSIFSKRGTCKRANAAWDDRTVDDRRALSEALPSQDAWLRVYIAEYIKVEVASKDLVTAITPSVDATMGTLRRLIAEAADTSPGALRMYYDSVELEDAMESMNFLHFESGSTITVEVETRECINCLDDVGLRDFPFEPTTDGCFHDLDICKQCIDTWITTSLDNGNWKNITCLSTDCGSVLQYADVRRGASAADMDRYERFATRDALSEMPGFKWCLASDCDAGQIHDTSGTEILTCNSCGFKRCTLCDRASHQDENCEQYTQRLAAQPQENDASEAWVANNSRKCPGCQSPIQKNDGCDHMTCTRCRRQFCWLCLADYANIHRQGNTAHAETCRYHSGNIIDPHAPPRHRPVPAPAARRGLRANMANPAALNPAPPVPQPGGLARFMPNIFGWQAHAPPAAPAAPAPVQPQAPAYPQAAADVLARHQEIQQMFNARQAQIQAQVAAQQQQYAAQINAQHAAIQQGIVDAQQRAAALAQQLRAQHAQAAQVAPVAAPQMNPNAGYVFYGQQPPPPPPPPPGVYYYNYDAYPAYPAYQP